MKALMRSYVYWPRMDCDIEDLVKSCQDCVLTAKSLPVKIQLWPKTSKSSLRLHCSGEEKDFYYIIIVDSFTKWPEGVKWRKATHRGQ